MYKTKLKWGTVMSDPCISWLDIINKKSQFLFHGSTIVGTKTGIIYIIYIIYWQLKVICIHIIINLFKRDCVLKFGQMLYKDNGSRIWIHFEFVHMVTWAPIGLTFLTSLTVNMINFKFLFHVQMRADDQIFLIWHTVPLIMQVI